MYVGMHVIRDIECQMEGVYEWIVKVGGRMCERSRRIIL